MKKNFWKMITLGAWLLAGCSTLPPEPQITPTPLPTETPAALPEPPGFSLAAGGDVTPAAGLSPFLRKYGPDYPYPYLAPLFKQADAGLVNLECPLSLRGKAKKGKKFTFCGQPTAAGALRRAGISVVSLANNHILDYGTKALNDTLLALDQAGIAHAGAGSNLRASRAPAVVKLPSGSEMAVLSYSRTFPEDYWAGPARPGTAPAELAWVQADVNSACAWAACVVVCFHWGGELVQEPRDYQIELGHAAIDAGAKVVVGTHPHILQGVEWYHRGLVLYSLGNLAFGGGQSKRAVQSAVVTLDFSPAGEVLKAKAWAFSVDNLATDFQPRSVSGPEAGAIFTALARLSAPWGTRVVTTTRDAGWAELQPPETKP